MMFSGLDELVRLGSAGVLVQEAIKAGVVLTVALLAMGLMRRSSAARRHMVLSLGIAGVLLLPLASLLVPPLEIEVPVSVTKLDPAVQVQPAMRLDVPDEASLTTAHVEPDVTPAGVVPEAGVVPVSAGRVANTITAASSASSASGRPSLPVSASTVMFALWALGVSAVLGRVVTGLARLRWIENRATPLKTGPLHDRLVVAVERAGLARIPTLLQGDDGAIPMTWGVRRAFVLLPVEADEWETWRIDAVLAHELGHISRGDYASQLAAQVVCALHWFNPLTWIAANRMRVEREHACDDFVLRLGYDGYSYAQELVELARSLRAPRLANAMCFARPNRLRGRLSALLDDSRDRRPMTHRAAVAIGSVALLAVLPLAALSAAPTEKPVSSATNTERAEAAALADLSESAGAPESEQSVAARPLLQVTRPIQTRTPQEALVLCGPADGEQEHHMHSTNDDVIKIDLTYGECRTEVRIEGEMEFNSDFSSLEQMGRGARLRIDVRRPDERRRVDIERGPDGRPEYDWSVDGRDAPFDGEAARWVEAAFLDMFRMTSFKADERAAWILRQEGVEGLLAEVEQMWSDHVQSRYLRYALADRSFTPAQVGRVLEFASANIESDHSLGQVLMSAAEHQTFGPEVRRDFIAATATLESDHTHGQVLELVLNRDDLSLENLEALLESASRGIESDHQMGQVLTSLVDRYSLDPTLRPAFLRAAATLESDHQKGEVYSVVLAQPGLNPGELAQVLEAATEIESDHTLAELLIEATAQDLGNAQLRSAFLEAARSIESDHSQAGVLTAALQLEGLTDADLAAILNSATSIESDHSLAELLLGVAGRGPAGPALRLAYLSAARSIDSDHNLETVLNGLVDLDLSNAELVELLDVARLIEGDHNLAALLVRVADRNPIEGSVRQAFMRALDTIDSEHSHGQVSSALVRR